MIDKAKLTTGCRTKRKWNAQQQLENSSQGVDAVKLTDWNMIQV